MNDLREGKSIGTSSTSDIKCSSYSQAVKVLQAKIYPAIGDEIKYYNESSGSYYYGNVIEYKSVVSIIIKCQITGKYRNYTLRKDGNWIVVRDKGLYNIFDVKYMYGLKAPDED